MPIFIMKKMIPKNLNVRKTNRRDVVYPKQFSTIRNEKSEPKYFSCNEFEYISKDCIHPCKKYGKKEHVKKNCSKANEPQRENLNVYVQIRNQ